MILKPPQKTSKAAAKRTCYERSNAEENEESKEETRREQREQRDKDEQEAEVSEKGSEVEHRNIGGLLVGKHGTNIKVTQATKPVNNSNQSVLSTPQRHFHSSPNLLSVSVKRQRLDSATAALNTLRKPFRSPLIVRRGDESDQSVRSHTPTTPAKIATRSVEPKREHVTRTHQPKFSTSTRNDPEIAALSAQVTNLRTRLKAAQTYLSMSQQALTLESLPPTHKDSDEHLEELIMRWRASARQAADYLFGIAGDRVNRMGGARAYFQRERERKIKWESDGEVECKGDDWSNDIDPEAREERKRQLMAEYDLDDLPTGGKSRREMDIAQTDDDVSMKFDLAFPEPR
ncbi:hypothetical protein BDZ91DRAFT_713885 [Kalaharituber pfeilii]|nr:hypothetical protein BDZ91DRAFT_713885 [Kalaharituber pfeilii]